MLNFSWQGKRSTFCEIVLTFFDYIADRTIFCHRARAILCPGHKTHLGGTLVIIKSTRKHVWILKERLHSYAEVFLYYVKYFRPFISVVVWWYLYIKNNFYPPYRRAILMSLYCETHLVRHVSVFRRMEWVPYFRLGVFTGPGPTNSIIRHCLPIWGYFWS